MIEFDHIGMVTEEKKAGEIFVEATRVWVTDFRDHPFRVEWLRFEPDTPVAGPVRTMPHLAFRTDSIAESSRGMKCLLEPFDTPFGMVGFYQTDDGAVIEFMEYREGEAKPLSGPNSMRWEIRQPTTGTVHHLGKPGEIRLR